MIAATSGALLVVSLLLTWWGAPPSVHRSPRATSPPSSR